MEGVVDHLTPRMGEHVAMKKRHLGEELQQTTDERNKHILAGWYNIWLRNAVANWHAINEYALYMIRSHTHGSILRLRKRKVTTEKLPDGSQKITEDWLPEPKGPAIVIGSGPTLDDCLPLLRDSRIPIFASASNAKNVLRDTGRQPEYICVFDAGDVNADLLQGIDWTDSMLITHPSASPRLISGWRWERAYYYMMHSTFVDLECLDDPKLTHADKLEQIRMQLFGIEFFETIIPTLYAPVGIAIQNAGCTSNNAIQIAHWAGYDPIYMVGVDMSFPDGKYRCKYVDRRNGQWIEWPAPDIPQDRPLHVTDSGLQTWENQVEYKYGLAAIWKIDKPNLLQARLPEHPVGLIRDDEIPIVDLREVVKNGGRGFEREFLDPAEIDRRSLAVIDRIEAVPDARDGDQPVRAVRDRGPGSNGSGEGADGQDAAGAVGDGRAGAGEPVAADHDGGDR